MPGSLRGRSGSEAIENLPEAQARAIGDGAKAAFVLAGAPVGHASARTRNAQQRGAAAPRGGLTLLAEALDCGVRKRGG